MTAFFKNLVNTSMAFIITCGAGIVLGVKDEFQILIIFLLVFIACESMSILSYLEGQKKE